jgi:hypothetical protein
MLSLRTICKAGRKLKCRYGFWLAIRKLYTLKN